MKKKKKSYVAVITPISYGTHADILSGIGKTAGVGEGECRVVPYVTRSLERSAIVLAAERALHEGACILITIGQAASIGVRDLLEKKQKKIPHICVASGDPTETGMMKQPEASGCLRTVVGIADYSREEIVRLTLGQVPTIKTALLPLVESPIPGASQWCKINEEAMKRECRPYRIELTVLKSKSYTGLFEEVFEQIPKYDALFLLEGDLLLEGHFTLSRQCYENKTVCYAGAYSAVTSTAFCGYSGGMYDVGAQVREYVNRILHEGDHIIAQLPYVEIPNKREPVINVDIAGLFGPLLPPVVGGADDGCGSFVSAPDAWHEERARQQANEDDGKAN